MFSIVIPTMQKDTDVLNKLLSELQEDDTVGEILVIDNSCKGFECAFDKVRVLVQSENLFVNPAWNYGIKMSDPKYPYFGVLNDDIIFPKNLFKDVKAFFDSADSSVGLAGIDCASNTPKSEFDTYPDDCDTRFEIMEKLSGFWGSAYFGNKKNYIVIPEQMKVFYGDHYLFTYNQKAGRNNYKITNITVKHLESLTSHSSKFLSDLFKADRKWCIRFDGVEHQKLSFVQRILSLTYYHEHYVLCLLGLKLKFKCRRKSK